MKSRKLEGILASAIPLVEAIFYRNSAPHTPTERIIGSPEPLINSPNITPYVGNFPESFAIPAIAGFVGDYIEAQGHRTGIKLLQKIGQHFPEVSATAVSTYFALGETILPQILPGTADIRDVPVVIISALAGYMLAKVGRKSGFNNRLYSISKNATQ
ncbi:MAG: hypothetical protein AABX10_04540 [Nanoarchaeota archaeon]